MATQSTTKPAAPRYRRVPRLARRCLYCGRLWLARADAKTCSPQCRMRHWRAEKRLAKHVEEPG